MSQRAETAARPKKTRWKRPFRSKKGNQLWEGVDRKERARIAQAVHEGRVLSDVAGARRAYALASARQARQAAGSRWWRLTIGAVGIGYLVLEIVHGLRGRRPYALPTVGAVWAFLVLVFEVQSWLTREERLERIRQAARLNRQLLEAHGIAVEDQEAAARRPWIVDVLWILDLSGFVALVAAVAVLPENSPGTRADHWHAAGLGACAFACSLSAAVIAFRSRRGGLATHRRTVALAGLAGLAIATLVLYFAVAIYFTGW
jgi:hypothetical protein